ncbi:hypothetical protein BGX20_001399 [Mortierella sp. AD010]|nr:hypothetical protein BGX20_001399 [Mortierella sp. AD010]
MTDAGLTRNTESEIIEVHAASGWECRLLETTTSFVPEGNGYPDLAYIKTRYIEIRFQEQFESGSVLRVWLYFKVQDRDFN